MVGLKASLTPNREAELIRLQGLQSNGKLTDKQIITLGQLLEKKLAKPELSATTKNYLQDIYKEEFFKRNKAISTKYTDKGIRCEEFSLTLYTEAKNTLLHKNKIRYNNDLITGEPDNTQGVIRDIKTSWDFTTFPILEDEIPNKDYYWQLQGYMLLTDMEEAELIYCLVDTPINTIEDELRRLDWKANLFDMNGNAKEESIPIIVEKVSNLIYTRQGLEKFCQASENVHLHWFENFHEIQKEHRIKVFEINRNERDIDLMKQQVLRARAYLNSLTT